MPEPGQPQLRVVIDVNFLVRSILSTKGGSALLMRLLKQDHFLGITCRQHLTELYRVLSYSRLLRKHRLTFRKRRRLVSQLYSRSIWVQPLGDFKMCRDPKDDYLIEMALLGQATHLVTDDGDFHEDADIIAFLAERDVRLARLGEFLEVLRNQ